MCSWVGAIIDVQDVAAPSFQSSADDLLELHWRAGDLRFLLLDHQLQMVDHFYENHARKEVWHCSRRIGKSAAALVVGMETCIQNPSAIVRYGAATQKDVKEIIHPIMRILTSSCPESIRPYWHQGQGKYLFPGKDSFMVVSGCDEGRADNLRGTGMDLGILDEAAFIEELLYVVRDILMPQLLTTGGRIMLASTSPRSSSHPFVSYMREAEREDGCVRLTIHQDSRKEVLDRIPEWCAEAGGPNSTTWRREYLCEIITDEESAIVPEFARPDVRARVVKQIEVPPYFIPYTVIDLGYVDHTAAVFGHVDFRRAKKVIRDELVLSRKNSEQIANAIRAKEKELWGVDERGQCLVIPRRYADGQPLTIADFNSIHGLSCIAVAKDTLEAEVNQLRLDIQTATMEIDPSCIQLIQQLMDGIWDKHHNKFERLPGFGHFDLVAALMYYARHANLRENPYPAGFDWNIHTHLIHNEKESTGHVAEALKNAFRLK